MFRLMRFLVSCVMFAAMVWFATSVPLGKHTLWGHLVRIARTDEAHDLATGARETAADVAKRVKDEARKDAPAPSPVPGIEQTPMPHHPARHERQPER